MRTFTLFRKKESPSKLGIFFFCYLALATGLLQVTFFIAVTVIVWKTIRYIRLGYKTTPVWISGLVTSIGMFVAGLLNGFTVMTQWL